VKILLTGRNGQVGWELERALPALGEVIATDRSTLDLASPDQIRRVVHEAKPDVIVNAAAYTAVDKAESEPELAMQINGSALGILAEEAKRLGALLVHYSTDYVFDGRQATPYTEDDPPNPLSVYGGSKLAGEREISASGCRHVILRTSWVYGLRGANFLRTVQRLAVECDELRVVTDQVGAPTWCRTIAEATRELLERRDAADAGQILHLSASGSCSRCEFAEEILKRTPGRRARVLPARTADFPSAAARPLNCRLSIERLEKLLGRPISNWKVALIDCLTTSP
jgi:dTDP-4-dehydrorhamnose reductase